MKKIIAMFAATATLLSLAACSFNRELTPEEIAAEQSKAVAQSIKAEEDYQAGMGKTVDKLGKTEKGKRIVAGETGSLDNEYNVYEFDKNQVLKKRYKYVFCNDPETYRIKLAGGDGLLSDVVDHDDKSRLVVYKVDFEEDPGLTYDYFYGMYKSEGAKAAGLFLVE